MASLHQHRGASPSRHHFGPRRSRSRSPHHVIDLTGPSSHTWQQSRSRKERNQRRRNQKNQEKRKVIIDLRDDSDSDTDDTDYDSVGFMRFRAEMYRQLMAEHQKETQERAVKEREREERELLLSCPICYEALKDHPVQALACMHVFHAKCVQPWLNRSRTCPTCRGRP